MSNNDGVKVLKGLEGVRLRFGMYAGSDPVQHMIKEVIDNSSDEYFKGICTQINIKVDTSRNYIRFEDNGSGLPNGWNEAEGEYNLYLLTQRLHAGTKFNDNDGEQRSGMNGIGIKIISALSKWGKTTSERNGERRTIEYSKGEVTKPVTKLKAKGKSGTITEFIPDDELLGDLAKINIDALKQNLKLRSYLNSGLRIVLDVDGEVTEYYSEEGVKSYIEENVTNPLFKMQPVILKDDIEGNHYEIAFSYENTVEENIIGFANSVILDRGTHETALKMVLTRIFSNYITENNLLTKNNKDLVIKGEDIRKGFKCIVNMRILNPKYSSQTKNELSNKEVGTHITKLFNEQFTLWMTENAEISKKIAQRIIQFALASERIKKEQEKIVKVNSSSSGLSFSNKYTECIETDPSKCEIFICEGKSASGSLRRGRDGKFQAIYALRGKPLNTFGCTNSKILGNFECNELAKILFGTNDLKNIDYDNVKFHHIIIASDADDDGLHIQALLAMMFHEHFDELIKRGYVYVACPPKYRITVNGKYVYFKNDTEYNDYKINYLKNKYDIQTKGVTLKDVVWNGSSFMEHFNAIKNKYSIPADILSMLLSSDTILPIAEYLDEQGLEVTEIDEDEFYVQGLLDNDWLDIELTKSLVKEIKVLANYFGCTTFDVLDKSDGTVYECDIADAIDLLDKAWKYTRYRYKGLNYRLNYIKSGPYPFFQLPLGLVLMN